MMDTYEKVRRRSVPERMQWIFDRTQSKKSILVIGEPEGNELMALANRLKVDVALTERKALVKGVQYLEKPSKLYDYVLYIGLKPIEDMARYPCKAYLKKSGRAFVIAPGGNGSVALSHLGMIRSNTVRDLEAFIGMDSVVVEFYRKGKLDRGGAKKSAVEARRLVQLVYASFDSEKEDDAAASQEPE